MARVLNQEMLLPYFLSKDSVIEELKSNVEQKIQNNQIPLRFASVATGTEGFFCEVESIEALSGLENELLSIFDFRERFKSRTNEMNVVLMVPTGIDCVQGGHAGDATPIAKIMGSVCDNLIIHPNVVNASDINEQPHNTLYVEGSLICRLMMGTIGLKKTYKNRIVVVTEKREDNWLVDQVVNTASAARAVIGVNCPKVIVLEDVLDVRTVYSPSGRASGNIDKIEKLIDVLKDERDNYDAIALATKITPHMDSIALHQNYFKGMGANPWGGAEAALTHAISSILNVPSAHAPTMSDLNLRVESYGQVDPRKAAEVISMTYLTCVLKGLNNCPQITTVSDGNYEPSEVHAEDIDFLVVPDNCIGLPVIAALAQGIKVIAVSSNKSLMKNDMSLLPWDQGQLIFVDSYFEAAGVIAAEKTGVDYNSIERPISNTKVQYVR